MCARIILAFLCAMLLGGTAAASAQDAETFIERMLRGVGAEHVDCPDEVRLDARLREMGAVCAVFDGDFRSFEIRWDWLRQRDPSKWRHPHDALPRSIPRTRWEAKRGIYERIYAVGETAIGVRFQRGEILLVYK